MSEPGREVLVLFFWCFGAFFFPVCLLSPGRTADCFTLGYYILLIFNLFSFFPAVLYDPIGHFAFLGIFSLIFTHFVNNVSIIANTRGGSSCWALSMREGELADDAPGTLTREDFFLLMKNRGPSRLWLAGRIHIDENGVTHVLPRPFDRRSHRRIRFGRSFVHPHAEYIHAVDPTHIVSVAASTGAPTMGQAEANERYKRKLATTIGLNVNLTPLQERQLRKMVPDIPFDIVGGKSNTSDHAVLAAARQLTRSIFDGMFDIIHSNLPTLVVGSTANDLDVYEMNSNVDHYFHGVETKDYMRTVVPLLERFAKKLKDNCKGSSMGRAVSKVSKTYLSVKSIIHDYKEQAGLVQSIITDIDKIESKYERLVCRDIYELGPKETEDLFRRTGANHIVGYGIYPDELQFPDLAPDPHYRFDVNRTINRATMTFRGACNGYSHNLDTWGWFLRTPVVNCTDFSMVTEITSRIGPYAIYTITRQTGASEYIPRTLALPERKHRALVLNLPATHLTGKQTRFAVNVHEWHAAVNFAAGLAAKSVDYHTMVLYVRRMLGGVSLVNKELTEPWQVKPKDVTTLALAVTVQVMRDNNVADEIIANMVRSNTTNLLVGCLKRPASFMDSIIGYVSKNGLSEAIAIYPDNEYFTLDSTPILRVNFNAENPKANYKVNLDFKPEMNVDCAFCKEVAPTIGQQVIRCINHEAPGVVDTSMTIDELKELMNGLIDDDEDPAGLAKLKAEVKKFVPTAGFQNSTKFSYIMGGPGAGKSHLIRSIALDPDAIYVPFTKLKVDYEGVPHPQTGIKRDLRFATTHRGLKLGMCRRLYVDEFTALDWRYLKLVIRLCSPDEVFIVGDTNQTGIRDGPEGVNITSVVEIDKLPKHQLMVNFRNQYDTVQWMNRMVPEYEFGSNKTEKKAGKGVASIYCHSTITDGKFESPKGAIEMFFTHAVAAAHGRTQRDGDKYTVRTFQGSTVDTAVVHLTARDIAVAEAPGMFLVALTRAKTRTYVVHDGSAEVVKFLTERFLPSSGPYEMDDTPVPVHVHQVKEELPKPLPPALDFVRRLEMDERADLSDVEAAEHTWLRVTSYQLGLLMIGCIQFVSPTAAAYLLGLMMAGFELETRPRTIFRFAQSYFLLAAIAQMHRTVTFVAWVLSPSSFITKWLQSYTDGVLAHEVAFVRTVFGPLIGRIFSVFADHYDTVVRFIKPWLDELPIGFRSFVLPSVFSSKIGAVTVDKFSFGIDALDQGKHIISLLPSTAAIVSSKTYMLCFALWILWYHRSARSVLKLSTRPGFGSSLSASVFSTTAHLTLGEGHVNVALDHFSGIFVRAKQMSSAYAAVAHLWIPEMTVFNYKRLPDLEAAVPNGSGVSGNDAFRMADLSYGATPFVDPGLSLTGAEQSMSSTEASNGQINGDEFLNPLDSKNRPAQPKTRFKLSSGWGYHFTRDNVAQSLKAIMGRYLNKKAPNRKTGPTAQAVADEIVRYARTDMFVPNICTYDEGLLELAIQEAEAKAAERGYDTQVSIDDPDANKIRMFMKETFKPGPLSSLKPFDADKIGMGVSPFNKTAHVTFATGMRYINLLILKNLKSNVIYDNRLTEDELTERLNEALEEVPSVAVNGVTDFKMYDSQQDDFCQVLVKTLITSLGISPDFWDHYLRFCNGSSVLSDGGIKGKLGSEKLSGDPATLLTNSLLGGMITNYLFRGEGPFAMAIKGDDGFKRQCELKVNPVHLANLQVSTRLQSIMCEEDPAEFCGKVVGRIMCQNIMRKFISITSKTYQDYSHFAQTQESIRDWVNKIESSPDRVLDEIIAQNAALLSSEEADGNAVARVRDIFDTIKSFGHVGREDWSQLFHPYQTATFTPSSSDAAPTGPHASSSSLARPDINFGKPVVRPPNIPTVRTRRGKSALPVIQENTVSATPTVNAPESLSLLRPIPHKVGSSSRQPTEDSLTSTLSDFLLNLGRDTIRPTLKTESDVQDALADSIPDQRLRPSPLIASESVIGPRYTDVSFDRDDNFTVPTAWGADLRARYQDSDSVTDLYTEPAWNSSRSTIGSIRSTDLPLCIHGVPLDALCLTCSPPPAPKGPMIHSLQSDEALLRAYGVDPGETRRCVHGTLISVKCPAC